MLIHTRLLLGIIFGIATTPLAANDASMNLGAHGPEPVGEFQGGESVVRMVSEKIDITFGKTETHVHCRFVFRSSKAGADAVQILGFPDFLTDSDTGTIRSMISRVDGKEVASKKQRGWQDLKTSKCHLGQSADPADAVADFYTITVTFPPDREVIVEREYIATNGRSVMGDTFFSYTTRTGGSWKDSIEKAEFHVTLDGWKLEDLAFEDGEQKIDPRQQRAYGSPNLSEWKVDAPGKLSLVWTHFEPAVHHTRQNIHLQTWNTRPQQ
ncbi:hypothetical protein [Prosthecobacter sp.]|uniref:hypothetical protein n=1 Tax=Prosthecobacter sp. TaxID=1965333 RepID=UPI0037853193